MDSSEEHQLACECREWKRLIKQNSRNWWTAKKEVLLQKRGEAGLKYLLTAMNRGK